MERIQLFIHHGKCETDIIYVDPFESVQNLDKYLSLPKKRFVFFNNNVLLGAFSYSFYKMKSGDHLYVVPTAFNISTTHLKESFNFFHRSNSSDDNMTKKPNPERRVSAFLRETARLKDQFLQKVDASRFAQRFNLSKITNMVMKPITYTTNLAKGKTVIPPKSSQPSTESLPVMWNEEETISDIQDANSTIYDCEGDSNVGNQRMPPNPV